jgi:hypothetical protein
VGVSSSKYEVAVGAKGVDVKEGAQEESRKTKSVKRRRREDEGMGKV